MARQIKKSDVVNVTGGVQTDDGRTLFGLDAEVYMKMKSKEDPEWERKVGEWIEDVLGKSIPDTNDLWKSLKSGVILCQLINIIKPGTIKKYNDKDSLHVLMERENINLYLDACYKLGVPRDGLFVTSDLHGRRNMSGVLANIRALSQIAGRFGTVKVAPLGNAQVNLEALKSNKTPSKWNVPQNTGPIMSGDLVEEAPNIETQLANKQKELQEAQTKVQKLEASNTTLRQDIQNLREQLRGKGTPDSGTPSSSAESPEISILRAEIDSLKKQLIESENKRRQSEQSLTKISATPTPSSAESILRTEIENLKKQLLESENKRRQSEQSVAKFSASPTPSSAESSLKIEIETLKRKLAESENKLRQSEQSLSKISVPATTQSSAESTLRNEISVLKKQLMESETKRRQVELTEQSLKAEIDSLKKNLAESEKKIPAEKISSNSGSSVQTLKEEIILLKKQLSDSESRRRPAEAPPLSRVLSEGNLAKTELSSLKMEIENLKRKNLDLENQLQTLKHASYVPEISDAPHYEEIDPALWKKLKTVLALILDPKKTVELEEVHDLLELFSQDSGRRYFTHLLKNHLESTTTRPKHPIELELDSSSFEVLLFLVNLTLQALDLQNGADYISAKMVLEMSALIYRKYSEDEEDKKEVKDYMEQRIKEHVIWQSLWFWEEYFWDTIAVNFRNFVGEGAGGDEEYSHKEKGYLKKQLQKFSKKMSGKLSTASVEYFISNMADSIGLDPEQTQAVLASVGQVKFSKKVGQAFKGFKKNPKEKKTEKSRHLRSLSEKNESTEKRSKTELLLTAPPPGRPAQPAPVMCSKCRQSFRFKYELSTHTCDK